MPSKSINKFIQIFKSLPATITIDTEIGLTDDEIVMIKANRRSVIDTVNRHRNDIVVLLYDQNHRHDLERLGVLFDKYKRDKQNINDESWLDDRSAILDILDVASKHTKHWIFSTATKSAILAVIVGALVTFLLSKDGASAIKQGLNNWFMTSNSKDKGTANTSALKEFKGQVLLKAKPLQGVQIKLNNGKDYSITDKAGNFDVKYFGNHPFLKDSLTLTYQGVQQVFVAGPNDVKNNVTINWPVTDSLNNNSKPGSDNLQINRIPRVEQSQSIAKAQEKVSTGDYVYQNEKISDTIDAKDMAHPRLASDKNVKKLGSVKINRIWFDVDSSTKKQGVIVHVDFDYHNLPGYGWATIQIAYKHLYENFKVYDKSAGATGWLTSTLGVNGVSGNEKNAAFKIANYSLDWHRGQNKVVFQILIYQDNPKEDGSYDDDDDTKNYTLLSKSKFLTFEFVVK